MLEAFIPSREEKNYLLSDSAGESLSADCAEDFVLPDYLPEIRKLVRVDAMPVSTGHFVGSEEVEWAGQVRYTLLYTDTEGKLTSVPLHTDYAYRTAHGGAPLSVTYYESIEGLQCRPAGPRKISIRCRVCAKPHLYAEKEAQTPLTALVPEGAAIEALPYHTESARVVSHFSDEYDEEVLFHLEGKEAEALQVKTAEAAVLMESLRAETGKILCRGNLYVSLLLFDGASLFTQSRRLPFETELSEEGVLPGDSLLAFGRIRSVECDIRKTETGAEISVLPSFVISAEAWRNTPVTLYTDAYAEGYAFAITGKVKKVLRFLGAARNSFTVSGETTVRDENATLVPLSAKMLPLSSALSVSGNQVTVSGECKASVLLERQENGDPVCTEEESLTFPFRLTLTLPTSLDATDEVEYVLEPLFATAKQEKGMLSVIGELGLSVRALRGEKISVPEKIDAEALPTATGENDIRIYYPTPKDSLWSVGKRYNLSLAALLAANDISGDLSTELDNPKSLDGIAWLLVRAL